MIRIRHKPLTGIDKKILCDRCGHPQREHENPYCECTHKGCTCTSFVTPLLYPIQWKIQGMMEKRILTEHKKHSKNLPNDWHRIAAQKIISTLIGEYHLDCRK